MLNLPFSSFQFLSSWIADVCYYTWNKIVMPFHHSASNSHASYSLSNTNLTTKHACICKSLTAAARHYLYLLLSNTCHCYQYKLNQNIRSKYGRTVLLKHLLIDLLNLARVKNRSIKKVIILSKKVMIPSRLIVVIWFEIFQVLNVQSHYSNKNNRYMSELAGPVA